MLIAVEGIDGAGKTTQVGFIEQFLRSSGFAVVRSKEPTDGPWGQKIRKSASSGRMSLNDELQAFIEDRKEHVRQVILPALSRGEVVLLDRYFYSTIAYQGARGSDVDELTEDMLRIAPEPDLVVLLDVAPDIGLQRIAHGRGETPNAFENEETLRAVRAEFLQLSKKHTNILTIDASRDIESVRVEVLKAISQLIETHRLQPPLTRC